MIVDFGFWILDWGLERGNWSWRLGLGLRLRLGLRLGLGVLSAGLGGGLNLGQKVTIVLGGYAKRQELRIGRGVDVDDAGHGDPGCRPDHDYRLGVCGGKRVP
jgi:hypothetical protein